MGEMKRKWLEDCNLMTDKELFSGFEDIGDGQDDDENNGEDGDNNDEEDDEEEDEDQDEEDDEADAVMMDNIELAPTA